MLILNTSKPTIDQFRELMSRINSTLNEEASIDPGKFIGKQGTALEPIVKEVAEKCSLGTLFEGTIQEKPTKFALPDIIASKYYGIEVKSTKGNTWKCLGNSILESTRVADVERIYLTFGKLSSPIQFKSRPYEDCLYAIRVTHLPRYMIDMDLPEGSTIFNKMNIPYDTLRQLPNPIDYVIDYYKQNLKEGEKIWWMDSGSSEETSHPMVTRWWNLIPTVEKRFYRASIYMFFPKAISGKSSTKYIPVVEWLFKRGIAVPNIRDLFSSGGKKDIELGNGETVEVSRIIYNLKQYKSDILDILHRTSIQDLAQIWGIEVSSDPLGEWMRLVVNEAPDANKDAISMSLRKIFL